MNKLQIFNEDYNLYVTQVWIYFCKILLNIRITEIVKKMKKVNKFSYLQLYGNCIFP